MKSALVFKCFKVEGKDKKRGKYERQDVKKKNEFIKTTTAVETRLLPSSSFVPIQNSKQ